MEKSNTSLQLASKAQPRVPATRSPLPYVLDERLQPSRAQLAMVLFCSARLNEVRQIADCLRCDFLPECHMAATEIRDRRWTLRYRHLLVRQMVQMKNRISGLLLETGVTHNKQRLHKVKLSSRTTTTTVGVAQLSRIVTTLGRSADSEGCRSAFRTDVDHHSEVMPISIPI